MIGSATLATAAVRAAYAALMPEGVQPGIEFVDVLAEHIADRRTRTNFRLVVERSIGRIADNLSSQYRHEFARLPENEQQAAIVCVRRTLDEGWPRDAALPKALAEPHNLQRRLRTELHRLARQDLLSAAATEFAVRALETCTSAAMALALEIEPVRNRRDWEIWFSVTGIVGKFDDLFGDFLEPNVRRGSDHEFAEFDRYFRTAVIEQLRTVQILGLPVDPDLNRQSLEQTMVPITVSLVHKPIEDQQEIARDGNQGGRVLDPSGRWNLQRLEEVVSRVTKSAQSDKGSKGVRLMVVGAAGSGKTTFCQWLAYRLARGQLPTELAPLMGTSPFFIRLRDVAKKSIMPSNTAIVGLS